MVVHYMQLDSLVCDFFNLNVYDLHNLCFCLILTLKGYQVHTGREKYFLYVYVSTQLFHIRLF